MIHIFEKNIIDTYGNQGKQWLSALPALTKTLTKKFQLTDLRPVTNMSFNYVASGLQHEKAIILKLGLDERALAKEATCLETFAHHGAAEILAHEPGMILMQQARPGATLKEYFPDKDQQATAILCQSIQLLHTTKIPSQHNFLHLKKLLRILDNELDIPLDILSKARQLRDALLASTNQTVLLHGDLHHENILKHDDGWLVIDPKGFIGDPVFEVCAFIHNPFELLEQASPIDIINKRIHTCAKLLNFSQQRIQDWLYVKSVLCWAWCLDDKIQPTYFNRFIKLLKK